MSKLFWILLAACRGGYRYLRAMLRFAEAALPAKLTQAPGSGGKGSVGPGQELGAEAVSRPVADGRLEARIQDRLAGRMVAWLVSVARFDGRTDAEMTMGIQASDAADLEGRWDTAARLTGNIEAAPGEVGAFRAEGVLGWDALALPGEPVGMGADLSRPLGLAGAASGGMSVMGAGTVAPCGGLEAGMQNGSSVVARGDGAAENTLSARMTVWAFPVWVDGCTLHIRQVDETQQDGDVLILR